MRHVVFLPLLAFLLGADTPKNDDVVSDDQNEILGTWKVVKGVRGGVAMPVERRDSTTFEFKDKKLVVHENAHEEPAEFVLDCSKTPKLIDIKPRNGPKAIYGIFEINGDTLKLCFTREGGNRPTAFESKEGTEVMLIVLNRQKK
jgi:uncharacterized protein (TIGR03067 family)